MAKLVLWLLSTQHFDKDVLVGGADLLLYQLNKALMYPSPLKGLGTSLLCTFYAIQCVQHIAGQIPTALQRIQHLWLPELWRLALVRMPANTHQVFSSAWLYFTFAMPRKLECCHLHLPPRSSNMHAEDALCVLRNVAEST